MKHLEGRVRQGDQDVWLGGAIAGGILSLWAGSLVPLLGLPLDRWPGWLIVIAILGRTFLHTGLFIVAHDAMHRSLMPRHPRLNTLIGRIAVWLYAFLPYESCRANHWRHHRYPAQGGDPDFHDGDSHPVYWYLAFIRAYLPRWQLVRFVIWGGVFFLTLDALVNILPANLVIVWLLPLVLSSMQLFFFGTYLPHRPQTQPAGSLASSRGSIRSLPCPIWWSFLTCYHFGYHWEHHTYPNLPWYRLPAVYHDCKRDGFSEAS
jgi:beta-carotene ketolase (CrtW type)